MRLLFLQNQLPCWLGLKLRAFRLKSLNESLYVGTKIRLFKGRWRGNDRRAERANLKQINHVPSMKKRITEEKTVHFQHYIPKFLSILIMCVRRCEI